VTSWSVRTSHARVLLCVARDPGVRLRDIAAGPGSTKRSACGIVTDHSRLRGEAERRPPQPLPEAAAADAAAVLEDDRYFGPDAPGGGEGDLSPAFVIRVRDHRPVMASRPGPARRAQWRGSAGGAGCLPGLGRPVRGEARVVSGESGCESGEEDAGASGTLNRAACGPAWLAAADHWASPSSPGLACCQAASAHAPVTRAAGVPAAGCAGQPRPDG
jgi:hypothetical protein